MAEQVYGNVTIKGFVIGPVVVNDYVLGVVKNADNDYALQIKRGGEEQMIPVVSPMLTTEAIEGGTRVTIEDISGTRSFDILNGKDGIDGKDGQDGKDGANGIDGQDGKDGVSPVVAVTEIENGHRVTITDAEGEKTFDVPNGGSGLPEGGEPYQQLVTDGEGKTVWEDRLAYSEEGVTIEWDGNNTGLESHTISLMGQQFLTWYVSDAVIDRANRDGLRVTFADGEEKILTEGDYYAELDTDEYYVIAEEAFMVEKAGTFPSRGVWFMDRTSPNLLKIEEPATVKTIDLKYAPKITVYAGLTGSDAYKDLDRTLFTKDEMLALGGNLNAVIVEVWNMTEGKFVEYCTPLAVGVFPGDESHAYMVIGRAHMNSDTWEMEYETKTIYTAERPA